MEIIWLVVALISRAITCNKRLYHKDGEGDWVERKFPWSTPEDWKWLSMGQGSCWCEWKTRWQLSTIGWDCPPLMNGRATLTLLVMCVHPAGCSNCKKGPWHARKKEAKKSSKEGSLLEGSCRLKRTWKWILGCFQVIEFIEILGNAKRLNIAVSAAAWCWNGGCVVLKWSWGDTPCPRAD